jgi:hypothetical protein
VQMKRRILFRKSFCDDFCHLFVVFWNLKMKTCARSGSVLSAMKLRLCDKITCYCWEFDGRIDCKSKWTDRVRVNNVEERGFVALTVAIATHRSFGARVHRSTLRVHTATRQQEKR